MIRPLFILSLGICFIAVLVALLLWRLPFSFDVSAIIPQANFTTTLSQYDLISSGQDMTCSFTKNNFDSQIHDTLYARKGALLVVQDATSSFEVARHFELIKDYHVYVWTNGRGVGTVKTLTDSSLPTSVNATKKFEVQCQALAPDPTLFQLPSGVIFKS